MKKSRALIIFITFLFSHPVFSQVSSPDVFRFTNPRLAASPNSGGEQDSIQVLMQLTGGFKEVSKLESDTDEKISGSVSATFLSEGNWMAQIGYTLNKISENEVSTPDAFFNSILNPSFGGNAFTLAADLFLTRKSNFSISSSFAIGLDQWRISDTLYRANPIEVKLLANFHPLSPYTLEGKNRIDLIFQGGISGRFLNSDFSNDPDFLEQKFQTQQTNYWGIELSASLIFNDLQLYFNPIFFLDPPENDTFPSNGIFNIGARIRGDLTSFTLRRQDK